VLVELDTQQLQARLEESQAQLRSAQAAYTSAKATAEEAEATAKRKRELHARGLASNADLEAAEAARNRARAQISTSNAQISLAQAGVKTAETSKGKTIIRSPIDGIVLARTVELGQTVTAGFQTPVLFTIGRDLTRMRLNVDVDEADVGKVTEGQTATFVVDAYPKRQFASKVLRLSNMPKADTTVVTYEAELSAFNDQRLLRPGMTATATIVTSEKKGVLTVPNAALRFQPDSAPPSGARPPGARGLPLPGLGGGMRRGSGAPRPSGSAPAGEGRAAAPRDVVWVVQAGALRRVPVQVGASDGRRSEVSGPGLTPGLQVAIDVLEPSGD
jgi:HlyD family secretion protein